jgi:hypothetical protein
VISYARAGLSNVNVNADIYWELVVIIIGGVKLRVGAGSGSKGCGLVLGTQKRCRRLALNAERVPEHRNVHN